MFVISATKPINHGIIPPPTTDMIIIELAIFVLLPVLLIPIANIVGNMIDMKKKIAIIAILVTVKTINKDRKILIAE